MVTWSLQEATMTMTSQFGGDPDVFRQESLEVKHMNVPFLHPRLPDSLKWRILGAIGKVNQRPHTEKTRRVILCALGG